MDDVTKQANLCLERYQFQNIKNNEHILLVLVFVLVFLHCHRHLHTVLCRDTFFSEACCCCLHPNVIQEM